MPDVISSRPRRRSFVPRSSAVPSQLAPPVPTLGSDASAVDATSDARSVGFLALRSAGPAWVGPGIVRALGTANVKFRASCLHLLASDPDDWRVHGLWINDRLVSGTEDLPGERCNDVESTLPLFHGCDVEVGDEIMVAAEYVAGARIGKRGFLNGAILSRWRPPMGEAELEEYLSKARLSLGQSWSSQFAERHRAFRACCERAAIRMSDEEAQRHAPEYQCWRDLARAGLVG